VLKFAELRFPAVSPFGWSVSPQQAAILSQSAKSWIYLPDADKRVEAVRVAGELAQRVCLKMPQLPDGVTDPEKLSAEQSRGLNFGLALFVRLMSAE
jgi:DNA primase